MKQYHMTSWNNDQLFSSKTHEWGTPPELYEKLDGEFMFSIDLAASEENSKCPNYLGLDHNEPDFQDALAENCCWLDCAMHDGPIVSGFLNPPYGRGVGDWVKKAYKESRQGLVVVMLILVRSDTSWWHKYVMKADEIRPIKGRLKFIDPKTGKPAKAGATAPSCVVVFRSHWEGPPRLTAMDRP